jgi:hypothetical protein
VICSVSSIGMLTNRSCTYMSNVISLWLSLMVSFDMSVARVVEFVVL